MAEMMQLPAEPVDEDDRSPLAGLDVVDAVAADVDELARRRHQPLGCRRDPPRRQHEIADGEERGQENSADDPADDRSHDDPTLFVARAE